MAQFDTSTFTQTHTQARIFPLSNVKQALSYSLSFFPSSALLLFGYCYAATVCTAHFPSFEDRHAREWKSGRPTNSMHQTYNNTERENVSLFLSLSLSQHILNFTLSASRNFMRKIHGNGSVDKSYRAHSITIHYQFGRWSKQSSNSTTHRCTPKENKGFIENKSRLYSTKINSSSEKVCKIV